MSSNPQVKNRAPAPIQITAEQLLREAKDRRLEDAGKAPKQFITDKEELIEYQRNKRKDFENQIRRQRHHIGTWCKYGLWEASQKEFENARSVFERALDVDYRNQTIWFKYIEMELKNKFINHARNILDRCVALHPRVDTFWFKYTYVEEIVGAIEQARQVFERWMKWEPDDMAWAAYIKFEVRQGEVGRARGIYERYCACHPTSRAYLKYAKWEETKGQKQLARIVYERALEEIHPDEGTSKLIINFARFEERCKEFDRCRVIYNYAMEHAATEEEKSEINQELIGFEKRHGNRQGIDDAILQNRRRHYEELVKNDKYNYDAWFDYIWLEEKEGDPNKVRAIYERAIEQIPPVIEKRYWKRYIYLWIHYALYEEIDVRDISRAREVYKRCLKIIPHKEFTFGKIWQYAAQLEVRMKDLTAARKIYGQAIGTTSY
jgi:crooked neck